MLTQLTSTYFTFSVQGIVLGILGDHVDVDLDFREIHDIINRPFHDPINTKNNTKKPTQLQLIESRKD